MTPREHTVIGIRERRRVRARDITSSATPMPPGRNDACPCGSGRKYKKCCGNPMKLAAARPALAPSEIIAGKRDLLHAAILRFANRRGGPEWMQHAMDTYVDEWYDELPRDEIQTMLPWALFHWPEEVSGLSMAEMLRESDTRRLDPDLLTLLNAEIAAHYSIWEVTETTPGVGIQMKDRLTGVERFVSDTKASCDVRVLESVLGRIVDYDGVFTFSGMFPVTLPPFPAEAVVSEMKRSCRVRTRPVSLEKLRNPERQLELLDLWRSMFDDAPAMPTLTNTDGDPMSFVSDRYDFDLHNRASIVSALMNIPGADTPPVDGDVREIVLTKPDSSARKSARVTVIAQIELQSARLKVATNSTKRADNARALIEAALGTLVRYRIREETSATAAMNPDISPQRESLAPDVAPTPEMQDAMRQFREQYMREWLDESIPALGGLTPREAAADKRNHKALNLLLRDVEYNDNRLPISERIDIQLLRSTLGM
jgi:SEC-C motif